MRSNGPSGRPLRIALLSSSRFWRGANNVFAVLARGLAERVHTTTAVVAYDAVAAGFRERHLAVRTLPVGHTTLRGARALRRGLRELAADIVLVDRARDIRLAAFASFNRPVVVVYCISTPHAPSDLLTRLAFRRVALTVFLTQQLAQRALAEAPFMRRAGHRVIPNGVDCDLFRPDEPAGRAFRQRHGLGDGPLLLAVGALEVEKRWDLLLQSLALLPAPAPRLVLCGSGALEGALRAQAGKVGLDVRLIGAVRARLDRSPGVRTAVDRVGRRRNSGARGRRGRPGAAGRPRRVRPPAARPAGRSGPPHGARRGRPAPGGRALLGRADGQRLRGATRGALGYSLAVGRGRPVLVVDRIDVGRHLPPARPEAGPARATLG